MSEIVRKDIENISKIFIKTVVEILNDIRIYKTEAEASKDFKIFVNGFDIILQIPAHYLYVDKGRKPNSKRPPVSQIYKWIKQNKIQIPENFDKKAFAFAVSNSIAKKGIKARPFIQDLQDAIAILTRDFVVNLINKNNTNAK